MSANLTTLRGTPAYAAGKFGNARTDGVLGTTTTGVWNATVGTVECWAKTTATSGCAVGNGQTTGSAYGIWLGVNAGKAFWRDATFEAESTITVNDGLWHHLAATYDGTNVRLWVDGALAKTYSRPSSTMAISSAGSSAIGGLGATTGVDWVGSVDEVRISNVVRYTAAFTPPTAAFTTDANTLSLYHLESSGTDETAPADGTAPSAPTNLTASPQDTSVALSWTASTDNVAVTGYEYSTNGTTYTSTGSTATTHTVTGLTPSTAYTFYVRAFDAAGNRSTAAQVSTTTAAAPDTTAPTAPTNLTATPTSNTAALTWTASTDNVGVTGYEYTTNGTTWTATGSTGTSYTVTGLTPSTAYTIQVRAYDSAGNRSASASVTTTTTAAPTIVPNDTNLVYSPYTWDVTATRAKTINSGAYCRALVQTSAITLKFDVTGLPAEKPQITYRVDGGPATIVTMAASVPLTIPSGIGWGKHVVEFVIKANNGTNRWATDGETVRFAGIEVSTGGVALPITQRPLKGVAFGDSITDGARTREPIAGKTFTQINDATLGWAYQAGEHLGAEIGVVGFSSQGWSNTGDGGSPTFANSWNLLWAGQARSWTVAPDFIVINHGTNGAATQAEIVTVLNAILAAVPTTTRIIVMRPFNGAKATILQGAVTDVANTRVTYLDTTGWWATADSSDNIHPYGYTSITQLGPRTAAAIKAALPGGGTSTPSKRFINKGGVAVAIG